MMILKTCANEEWMLCLNQNFNCCNLMLKIIIVYIIYEENYIHCVRNQSIGTYIGTNLWKLKENNVLTNLFY